MLVHSVTINEPNGRLFVVPPVTTSTGLRCLLATPASSVNSEQRSLHFTAAAYDGTGTYLCLVDTAGKVEHALGLVLTVTCPLNHGSCVQSRVTCCNLKANRYVRLDKAGAAGTRATFSSAGGQKQLFVGFEDSTIRAYDVVKSVQLGILREHRNPPRHLQLRECSNELLSTSIDGAIIWDAKKLCRRRALGSGPYGVVQASFTPDESRMVTAFKDGSFYVWSIKGFHMERSFMLPFAPQLRTRQTTFALSPDGAVMVTAGPLMPLLLVYNLLSGELQHGIELPDVEAVSGATQLAFLPDGGTVAALCTDGGVRFVDVHKGEVVAEIPYMFPNQKAQCCFSMDTRCNSMALVSDGKVLLYDLTVVRSQAQQPLPLRVVRPEDIEAVYAKLPQRILGVQDEGQGAPADTEAAAAQGRDQHEDQQLNRNNSKRPEIRLVDASAPPRARRAAAGRGKEKKDKPGALTLAGDLGENQIALNKQRLQQLLEQFGEYPAKYRLLIWGFLLRLPRNNLAFQNLVNRGLHPAYKDLEARFPLQNRSLLTRLALALSQLAHWCPVFAETGFMPGLVFPFVKLHAVGATAACNESCFEMLATLLISWMRGWFEKFPEPPLGVLSRLDALLAQHDAPLASHLRATFNGGVASVAWSIMQDLLTGVLTQPDWLKLWDHCITAGPDYLYYFITAYFIGLRATLLTLDTQYKLENFMGKPPTIDCNRVLRAAYELRMRTPDPVRPAMSDWDPLPPTGAYTEFTHYPAAAVELFAQERRKIAEAEEALARRRKVVSELALRSKAVALQANSLATERAQLSELHHQRREQLRQIEASMISELQKLDDKAKEEKLKQVATIERAQQEAAASLRAEWQRELEVLKRDIAARKRLMATQVTSKAEDEAINQLEFAARQKMAALEAEAQKAAMLSKMKDEVEARSAEMEAKQRNKLREWERQEEERRLKIQHEEARRRRLAAAAEDSAAQAAVRKELLVAALSLDDHITQVEAERKMRALAEEQATLTADMVETEAQRAALRVAADEQTLALQAQADAAWFAAEQQRREALLSMERDTLAAAEARARQKLAETQAQVTLYSSQAALLERRRVMEAVSAEEEVQARRILDAIAVERARAAVLVQEMEGREAALGAMVDHARRVGSMQREVGGADVQRLEAARDALRAAQAQDLSALKLAQERELARMSAERDKQELAASAASRAEMQQQELAALQAHVATLEARRKALEQTLGPDHEVFTRSTSAAPVPAATPAPVPATMGDDLGAAMAAAMAGLPRPAVHRRSSASSASRSSTHYTSSFASGTATPAHPSDPGPLLRPHLDLNLDYLDPSPPSTATSSTAPSLRAHLPFTAISVGGSDTADPDLDIAAYLGLDLPVRHRPPIAGRRSAAASPTTATAPVIPLSDLMLPQRSSEPGAAAEAAAAALEWQPERLPAALTPLSSSSSELSLHRSRTGGATASWLLPDKTGTGSHITMRTSGAGMGTSMGIPPSAPISSITATDAAAVTAAFDPGAAEAAALGLGDAAAHALSSSSSSPASTLTLSTTVSLPVSGLTADSGSGYGRVEAQAVSVTAAPTQPASHASSTAGSVALEAHNGSGVCGGSRHSVASLRSGGSTAHSSDGASVVSSIGRGSGSFVGEDKVHIRLGAGAAVVGAHSSEGGSVVMSSAGDTTPASSILEAAARVTRGSIMSGSSAGSLQMGRSRGALSPDPSSPGDDVTDVDGLINRLRMELDMTETEDEEPAGTSMPTWGLGSSLDASSVGGSLSLTASVAAATAAAAVTSVANLAPASARVSRSTQGGDQSTTRDGDKLIDDGGAISTTTTHATHTTTATTTTTTTITNTANTVFSGGDVDGAHSTASRTMSAVATAADGSVGVGEEDSRIDDVASVGLSSVAVRIFGSGNTFPMAPPPPPANNAPTGAGAGVSVSITSTGVAALPYQLLRAGRYSSPTPQGGSGDDGSTSSAQGAVPTTAHPRYSSSNTSPATTRPLPAGQPGGAAVSPGRLSVRILTGPAVSPPRPYNTAAVVSPPRPYSAAPPGTALSPPRAYGVGARTPAGAGATLGAGDGARGSVGTSTTLTGWSQYQQYYNYSAQSGVSGGAAGGTLAGGAGGGGVMSSLDSTGSVSWARAIQDLGAALGAAAGSSPLRPRAHSLSPPRPLPNHWTQG